MTLIVQFLLEPATRFIPNSFTIQHTTLQQLCSFENVIIRPTVTSVQVFRDSRNKKDIVPFRWLWIYILGPFNLILGGTLKKAIVPSRLCRYTAILLTCNFRTFCHCKIQFTPLFRYVKCFLSFPECTHFMIVIEAHAGYRRNHEMSSSSFNYWTISSLWFVNLVSTVIIPNIT